MNILAVGDLGPHGERLLALPQAGHKVVYGYAAFRPVIAQLERELPCVPLARRDLRGQIRQLIAQHEIAVIYCLLNSYDASNEIALELLDAGIGTPIVRHYKEHPCAPNWQERRVLLETAGQIYINQRSLDYFRAAYGVRTSSAHILDADLIAERHMTSHFSPKLRTRDGEPHLLVAGSVSIQGDRTDVRRFCDEMNRRRVHVHLYCVPMWEEHSGAVVTFHEPTRESYARLAAELPYVHQHEFIRADSFSLVWSCYDAGVMHMRVAEDDPDACFERMNFPCRYSAYLAAGLPLVVQRGGQDALETLIEQHRIGIVFDDFDDLAGQLYDNGRVCSLSEHTLQERKRFSFDRHVPHLVAILSRYAQGA